MENKHLTTEPLRHAIPMCIRQLYSAQITCREALHKLLFSVHPNTGMSSCYYLLHLPYSTANTVDLVVSSEEC